MSIKRLSRALGIAAGFTVMMLSPTLATAQEHGYGNMRAGRTGPDTSRPGGDGVRSEIVTGTRIRRDYPDDNRQRPSSPAAVKAQAEALLASSSTSCAIGEAKLLVGQPDLYEVTCAEGPGYILAASTPAQAVDCVLLDSQPETGAKCTLAGNRDIQGFLKAYAVQAGVTCTVDDARARGRFDDGAMIYEIGCAGADGYWIEKTATGWEKTDCLQVVSQGATCQLTTPVEQAATVKSWLSGSEAADCDVQMVRLIGENGNDRFIEMTCAGADGAVARFNAQHAVQQVYSCAAARQIGGCKLTTALPATTPSA